MTDHLHDSEITAALKRAETAEREAAKMRELYAIDGDFIGALVGMLGVVVVVALVLIASLWLERRDAITARDALQVQSQLYLDGWKQCKREAGERTLQEDYGDGSLLDPVVRIDR